MDDFILQHPSNDGMASSNPSGKEENSNLFRVHSKTLLEITLEALPMGYIVGEFLVKSMKRTVDSSQLLNGKWWIKE